MNLTFDQSKDAIARLGKRIAPAPELYQRQIAATDKQIDALVYDLYGLTDTEIALVEGAESR